MLSALASAGAALVANDQLRDNVELLLLFNGTDGQTTTTEYSPTPKTVTFNGGAELDTSIKKWGESSLLLDGSTAYVTVTDNAGFTLGTQDFTLEGWIYLLGTAGTAANAFSFFNIDDDASGTGLELNLRVNGTALQALVSSNGSSADMVNASGGSVGTATWQHIVLEREGSVFTLGLDGTSVATATSASSINHSSADPVIGRLDLPSNYFYGHIDDLRLTVGAVRYGTFPYTPPSQQLPTF